MQWYYAENGQQAGPVSEAEFENLITVGRVTRETLVWREGMDQWLPFEQVQVAAVPASTTIALAKSSPAGEQSVQTGGSFTPAPGDVQCSECRRYFPESDVIRYGTASVCGACKPAFLQRIREAGSPAGRGAMDYAGFWIRVGAKIIDSVIMTVPMVILWFLMFGLLAAVVPSPGSSSTGQPSGAAIGGLIAVGLGFFLLIMIVAFGYPVFFVGKYGATPGKMLLRLKVVRTDGGPVGYMRAFGRVFGEMISAMIFYIGYIMILFDEEKASLHDKICDTRVIHV